MNLIKQDVCVWVKETPETPKPQDYISVFNIVDGESHWLKSIKQVYVFTPGQLGRLIKDALIWYDDTGGSIDQSARDFLNSITK